MRPANSREALDAEPVLREFLSRKTANNGRRCGVYGQVERSQFRRAFPSSGPSGTSLIRNTNVPILDPLYTRTDGRYVMNVRNREGTGLTDTPEPATWTLAGSTLALLGFLQRRKRQALRQLKASRVERRPDVGGPPLPHG